MTHNDSFENDIKWFKSCLENEELSEKLSKIKLVVSDIDGTLTDANIFLPLDSQELKGLSIQDGYITAKAIAAGVNIAYLSGRSSSEITKRAQKLGIPLELCAQGINDKINKVQEMQAFTRVTKEETLIFGDDYMDYEIKDFSAIYAIPANAPFYFHPAADLVLPKNGGQGAFRLLLDLILYIQNKHFAQDLISKSLKKA